MRRVIAAGVVLAVAACMIGCGGGDYASPKATFETMVAAAKKGDKDALMACFCEADRKNLAEMEKIVKEMVKLEPKAKEMQADMTEEMMKEFKDAEFEFGEPKIDGDKATLGVTKKGEKKEEKIKFVKEKGGWKIVMGAISDKDVKEAKEALEAMKKAKK